MRRSILIPNLDTIEKRIDMFYLLYRRDMATRFHEQILRLTMDELLGYSADEFSEFANDMTSIEFRETDGLNASSYHAFSGVTKDEDEGITMYIYEVDNGRS